MGASSANLVRYQRGGNLGLVCLPQKRSVMKVHSRSEAVSAGDAAPGCHRPSPSRVVGAEMLTDRTGASRTGPPKRIDYPRATASRDRSGRASQFSIGAAAAADFVEGGEGGVVGVVEGVEVALGGGDGSVAEAFFDDLKVCAAG